jgi:hypothetical protein
MSKLNLRAGLGALAAALVSLPAAPAAFAQSPPVHPTPPPRVQLVTCAASIQVTMNPTGSISPWTYGKGPFAVTLDPVNHPRVEGGQLICYYQALKQIGAFVIYQPVGARHCAVRPDNKGFDCTP